MSVGIRLGRDSRTACCAAGIITMPTVWESESQEGQQGESGQMQHGLRSAPSLSEHIGLYKDSPP